MDRRTYESPMDWEYQHNAPVDPSSPFIQAGRKPQPNPFGSPSKLNNSFGSSTFGRNFNSSSKPLPPTPQQSSAFSNSQFQRTHTAPAFRNPAFTTPRKPFDLDALSEISGAESSPAFTEASDADTPEIDRSYDFAQMTITPAKANKSLHSKLKQSSGKGEIYRTSFESRDKVRKRKRYNGDKDISGYRLPYKQDWEGSDNESDDSTAEPRRSGKGNNKGEKDGWFSSFLGVISRHPEAPGILSYWLQFFLNGFIIIAVICVLWAIIGGFREDFHTAKDQARADLLSEMAECSAEYVKNRCSPIDQRVPAMNTLCNEWEACMNRDPESLMRVRIGVKNIIDLINEIVESMTWKTIGVLTLIGCLGVFSGASLFSLSKTGYAQLSKQPPVHSQHSQAALPMPFQSPPGNPNQAYIWAPIQTPSRRLQGRHHYVDDGATDTDNSPDMKMIMPPQTPSGRRSPSKGDRGRSPTKGSRSPTKGYLH